MFNIQDVLLLADINEHFIHICLNNYQLYPVHYLTSSSLCLYARLKLTKTNLELIEDNIYMTIERGKEVS